MTQHISGSELSRRALLALGVGAGFAVATGCRTQAAGTGSTGAGGKFRAPNFKPPEQIEGALISKVEGVSPAYIRYPAEQFTSVAKKPGRGGDVSTFQVLEQAPPPKNNPWLTAFDKRLGVTLHPTYAAGPSYGQKVQTLLASGDLPDIAWIERSIAPGVVKVMRQDAFTDLSDIVAGSGIDDYPNLARIPTYAWRNSSIGGRILGVPRVLPLVNEEKMYRTDWASDLGFTEAPKNAEEVKKLLAAFTKGSHRGKKKSGRTWGLARLDHGLILAVQMFRVPNDWRLGKDGRLTYEIETDEYEAAIAWLVELWKSGAFHPDAATLPVLDGQDMFMSGRIGLMPAGIAPHYRTMLPTLRKNDPKAEVASIALPGHDGGDPIVHQAAGYFGLASIPSSVGKNEARLKELLRIIDYWCAPFGSEEHTFVNYGIEGRHFNYDKNGTPTAVEGERPLREVTGPSYLVQPLEGVLFFPGDTEAAAAAQKSIEKAVPLSVPNPTSSLISETAVTKTAALDQLNHDYLYGIITGRRSIKEIGEWRKRWRSRGGDKIRKEYEAGLE